jgi:tRNA(fMet)-specific endonuclease VapC
LPAAPESEVSRRKLLTILPDFDTLNFDVRAAREYGNLVASLRKQGATIGVADAMIAAIALANGAALITRNLRHFNRIPNLRLITH